jgi:hypothetical protein
MFNMPPRHSPEATCQYLVYLNTLSNWTVALPPTPDQLTGCQYFSVMTVLKLHLQQALGKSFSIQNIQNIYNIRNIPSRCRPRPTSSWAASTSRS